MSEKGKILAICSGSEKSKPKRNVHQASLVKNFGIEGDIHASTQTHKQVSLLAIEHINSQKEKAGDISEGYFGENLIIDGLWPEKFPVGTQFRSGDVLFELTQIGVECDGFDREGTCLISDKIVFCKVLMGGILTEGDFIHAEA